LLVLKLLVYLMVLVGDNEDKVLGGHVWWHVLLYIVYPFFACDLVVILCLTVFLVLHVSNVLLWDLMLKDTVS